jgi:ArsR family transcriptional regulator
MTKTQAKSASFYERRASIAKSLGHPSRLMIADVLRHGERCLNDLTEIVGADQSTVSRHLALLKNAGLLETRKEGAMIFYSLRVQCLEGFFSCMDAVLQENRSREETLMRP